MKNMAAIAVIALFVACENQDIKPSSNITRQDRTIEVYSGIEIGTAFETDITYSATEDKIEIEANENLHAYIDVMKVGNNLVIKVKDNTNIQGNSTLRAHIITSNIIEYIAINDASNFVMNNTQMVSFLELNVSDASTMSGRLEADETNVSIDDGSSMDLQGSSNKIYVNASDASVLSGLNLTVKDATLRLSSASSASLTVTETIDLVASGASVFSHKGGAVITNLDLSDASQIVPLD